MKEQADRFLSLEIDHRPFVRCQILMSCCCIRSELVPISEESSTNIEQ